MNLKPNLTKISNSFFIFALGIPITAFCINLYTFTEQFLRLPPSFNSIFFGIIVNIGFIFYANYRVKNSFFYSATTILCGFIAISIIILISRQFIDVSYDGLAYHGGSILYLDSGWNPVWEKSFTIHGLWQNSYPKSAWNIAASIYKLTKNFSDLWVFNVLFYISSVFTLSFALKKLNFKPIVSIILAILACSSPVTLTQFITLNLDGQISALLVIIFSLCALLYQNSKKVNLSENFKSLETPIYLALFGSTGYLINIKTAGLVYGIFIISSISLYFWYQKTPFFKKFLSVSIFSILIAISVIGFNPYLTNIRDFKNIVYPTLNKVAFDFTENTPSNYLDKSVVEIVFSSIFFKSDNIFVRPYDNAELKLPFTIYQSEIESISDNAALKKGGFGPLFSGFFVLTALYLGIILFLEFKNRKTKRNNFNTNQVSETKPRLAGDPAPEWGNELDFSKYLNIIKNRIPLDNFKTFLFIIILTTVSCLLSSTGNTFRYIPQFWLLLVFIIGFCYQRTNVIGLKNDFFYYLFYFSNFVIIFGFITSLYFAGLNINRQKQYSDKLNGELIELKSKQDKGQILNPIIINFGYQNGTAALLDGKGIKYISIVPDKNNYYNLPCKNVIQRWNFLTKNESMACIYPD